MTNTDQDTDHVRGFIAAALPWATYIAQIDDLARILVRFLNTLPVSSLPYRDQKRLNRITKRLISGISRPELLLDLSKRTR